MDYNWSPEALRKSLKHFDWTLQIPCTNEQWQAYLDTYQLPNAQQDYQHFSGLLNLPDHQAIVVQAWQPKAPQGTAFILHGLYDHVGLYRHLFNYCLERNLRVISFDLPGHGLSAGVPASIASFQQYDQVFTKILSNICVFFKDPLHVFGQSTGGAIIINYLLKYGIKPQFSPFASVNLIAPLVRPKEWRKIRMFYWLLKHVKTSIKRGRSINSQDREFLDFLWRNDPLQAKQLGVNWIGAMVDWNRFIHQQEPSKIAINIAQGDNDNSVLWRYNLAFLSQRFPNQQVKIIPTAGHHLINEITPLRQQMWAFFDAQLHLQAQENSLA